MPQYKFYILRWRFKIFYTGLEKTAAQTSGQILGKMKLQSKFVIALCKAKLKFCTKYRIILLFYQDKLDDQLWLNKLQS